MFGFLKSLFGGGQREEPQEKIEAKIELYKADWCPHCKTAARFLVKIPADDVRVYDVDRDKGRAQEMVKRTGGRTSIPQIFINDVHIGGSTDLVRAAQSGRLNQVLGLS